MANVSGYTFENMARINNDNCFLDQRNIQNVSFSNYMLQNYFANDCTMNGAKTLATSQPGVFYRGGFNTGAGGCNIDDNSNLTIGTIQTHPKCKIDLFQRPFASVPYLGRGSVNPIIESQIQQGEMNINRRSVSNLSEKSYIKYQQAPLLSSIQDRVSNPANFVEGVANQGWIRGGVPSRELTRDAEFTN